MDVVVFHVASKTGDLAIESCRSDDASFEPREGILDLRPWLNA